MITYKDHAFDHQYDACRRCWVSGKLLKCRPETKCQVPDDALHRGDSEWGGLEWRGNPGYFYYCKACDFLKQMGEDGACGEGVVHECRHGNRGIAYIQEPLEVVTDFLQALHFKKRDPYAEHRESLRGIEVVDLKPADDLGDAWSTATWEEL